MLSASRRRLLTVNRTPRARAHVNAVSDLNTSAGSM
jgi:hypothetical protein